MDDHVTAVPAVMLAFALHMIKCFALAWWPCHLHSRQHVRHTIACPKAATWRKATVQTITALPHVPGTMHRDGN